MKRATTPPPGVDPRLEPFIKAVARLLADDHERREEARRALGEVVEAEAKSRGRTS